MNTYDDYLTFALGKGRLSNKTMDLLEQIGITCEEMKTDAFNVQTQIKRFFNSPVAS